MAGTTARDDLLRWLLGGLVAGAIVLGLLAAAYKIGYHRGQRGKQAAASAAVTSTPAPTTTNAPAAGAAARGKELFTTYGCSGCHSLTGAAGAGPTMKGLAGSSVQLSDGRTVTADDAYLTKATADPDAEIVKGYGQGVMSAAIASFDLASKPQDVAALVAFVKQQR